MAELRTYHRRVRAFTLFESVAAIAIISVLIGIVTLVYSNLVNAEKPIAYYQAKEDIDRYYADLKQTNAFISRNFSTEIYNIEQKVDFHRGDRRIYLVEYIVTAQNKKWWAEKHLLANPDYAN